MLYLHNMHRFDAAIKAAVFENSLPSGSAKFFPIISAGLFNFCFGFVSLTISWIKLTEDSDLTLLTGLPACSTCGKVVFQKGRLIGMKEKTMICRAGMNQTGVWSIPARSIVPGLHALSGLQRKPRQAILKYMPRLYPESANSYRKPQYIDILFFIFWQTAGYAEKNLLHVFPCRDAVTSGWIEFGW